MAVYSSVLQFWEGCDGTLPNVFVRLVKEKTKETISPNSPKAIVLQAYITLFFVKHIYLFLSQLG